MSDNLTKEKKKAHETWIDILNGKHNETLDEYDCGESQYTAPVIALEVVTSDFPDEAKPDLIAAFIHAGKQSDEGALESSVALALKHLNGGQALLAELKGELGEDERDSLKAIAKRMELEVPEEENEDGGE